MKLGRALSQLSKKLQPDSINLQSDKKRMQFVEVSGTEIQLIMNALRYAGPACTAISKFVVPLAKRRKVRTEERANLFFSRPILMTSDDYEPFK